MTEVEIMTAQFANLTLGAPEQSIPAKKTRFILKSRFDAVVTKFVKSLPVASDPPSFTQLRRVSGVKRCLEKSGRQPREPDLKRQKVATQAETDLDVFERSQKVTWETYEARFSGRRHIKTVVKGKTVFIRTNEPRVERVIKVQKQARVISLPLHQQTKAYQQLLTEAGISSIPHYYALHSKHFQNIQDTIVKRTEDYKMREKRLKKAQNTLRCYNSLRQKEYRKKVHGRDIYHEERPYWMYRVRMLHREAKQSFKHGASLRALERGVSGLVCTFSHPPMPQRCLLKINADRGMQQAPSISPEFE